MPGSVQNANPTTVMPRVLCRLFRASRQYWSRVNQYRDGRRQVALRASTSRKSFELACRLTPTELASLRSFYEARNGPQEPFYFYYPWETSPRFSHDPTGTQTVGRYTVRFEGDWSQVVDLARGDVSLRLIEVN